MKPWEKPPGSWRRCARSFTRTSEPAKAAIFAAHEELLDDPDLLEIATSAIAKGKSAAFAWKNAVKTHADRLAGLRNQLLAQRANDLRDVGLRVLGFLTGIKRKTPAYPHQRDPHRRGSHSFGHRRPRPRAVDGVCHGARRRDLARRDPCAFAGHPGARRHRSRAALELPNGTPVILDGSKGTLRLNPSPGGNRPHPPTRRSRHEKQRARKTSRTRTSRRSRSTAHTSKSSPTSAG